MKAFFCFEKLVSVFLVKVLFVVLVLWWVAAKLFDVKQSLDFGDVTMAVFDWLALVAGVLIIRVACEIVLLVFHSLHKYSQK